MKFKRNPLIIISASRSGSSCVAGIFAKHGFWVGKYSSNKGNVKGHFENSQMRYYYWDKYGDKKAQLSNQGWVVPWDIYFENEIYKVFKAAGYPDNGEPWFVKFGANWIIPWYFTYPNATIVTVRRNPESIVQSGKVTREVTPARLNNCLTLMKIMENEFGAFRVDFENIIKGTYEQLFPVFKREGVKFSSSIADKWVDPGLVHYG